MRLSFAGGSLVRKGVETPCCLAMSVDETSAKPGRISIDWFIFQKVAIVIVFGLCLSLFDGHFERLWESDAELA